MIAITSDTSSASSGRVVPAEYVAFPVNGISVSPSEWFCQSFASRISVCRVPVRA
jgi:hypothetical protein